MSHGMPSTHRSHIPLTTKALDYTTRPLKGKLPMWAKTSYLIASPILVGPAALGSFAADEVNNIIIRPARFVGSKYIIPSTRSAGRVLKSWLNPIRTR